MIDTLHACTSVVRLLVVIGLVVDGSVMVGGRAVTMTMTLRSEDPRILLARQMYVPL